MTTAIEIGEPVYPANGSPEEVQWALDIARAMAKAGIPIFTARPDTNGLTPVGRATGFMLPKGWEMTQPDPAVVDRWQPGWALCAVGGHVADFVDVDPRHDGDLAAEALRRAGHWPDSYGTQSTPSGGSHDIIAPLGIRKTKRDGIDYQGGDPVGNGRGFVFIAPTVRPSKETGELVAYRWEVVPNLPGLKAARGKDKSGDYFGTWITTKPTPTPPLVNGQRTPASGTKESEHVGRIPPGQGHDSLVRYCGMLLKKYPEIEESEYVEKCRKRWAEFDQSEFSWTWAEAYANPVMDCWHRFERGEIRIPLDVPDLSFRPTQDEQEETGDPKDLILSPEFYDRRPVLRRIRRYAHDRCAGADAVLYATLARISGMVRPSIRVDTGILTPASLNLFVAACGPAGSGKSSSASVAKGLYRSNIDDFQDCIPLGSGEGLCETFFEYVWIDDPKGATNRDSTPKKVRVKEQTRHNAFVVSDEGQAMLKLMEKSGSVLGETIRSLWVGATAGQGNANAETRRILPEGSYSIGMLVGFQPSTIQPLLADCAGGTPQRFVYCWVIDPTIPEESTPEEGPFASVEADRFTTQQGKTVTVVPSVRDEIRRTHLARKRGLSLPEPYDEHDYLTVTKLAALLAILENRYEVREDDWEMAGEMYRVSCNVRAEMLRYGRAQNKELRDQRNRDNATREGLAEAAREAAREAHGKPWRLAVNIANKVHGNDSLRTVGAVNRLLPRRDSQNQELVSEAWEIAQAEGWVKVDGTAVEPDEQRPA